jgi:dihydrofolate reductase
MRTAFPGSDKARRPFADPALPRGVLSALGALPAGGLIEFGYINAVPKFVASRTLKGPLAWQNSTLIEGDLFAFVREIKAGEGGEIAVMSSISLVRQLLFAGLLDELTLITHPVIAGEGRHLFEPQDPTTRLTLTASNTTSKGNVVSTYARRA